jgi:CRISPR-associated protein Cmr5
MSTSPAPSTTLDQQRAADALARVNAVAEARGGPGHYVSYVAELPAMIAGNGLGQALAMLLAKARGRGDDPHAWLYNHVAGWLSRQVPELVGEANGLLQRLMDNDQRVYLRAQVEAMAYVHWLKTLARARLTEAEGSANE